MSSVLTLKLYNSGHVLQSSIDHRPVFKFVLFLGWFESENLYINTVNTKTFLCTLKGQNHEY